MVLRLVRAKLSQVTLFDLCINVLLEIIHYLRRYAAEAINLEGFKLFLQFIKISFYLFRVRVFNKGLIIYWLRFNSYDFMIPFFEKVLIWKKFVKRFVRSSIDELPESFIVFLV